jgi:GAF domain-containing protein
LRKTEVVHVPYLERDQRWPLFSARAGDLGVRSVLAAPLVGSKGAMGVLNLSAPIPNFLGGDDVVLAAAFARHLGVLYAAAEVQANLRVALDTRAQIGQAVGILMERHRLTPEASFDRLVAASKRLHRRVRDIALQILDTGEDPETIGP